MNRLISALLFFVALHLSAADKPNIVFIYTDDLGINDLSCYGRKDQQTPNLDKLATQGVQFSTAYCAQPICSPSRAALMTGKSPARLHLTTFLPGRPDAPSQLLLHPKINQQLPLEEVTIAETLKANGYATACVGKWHLGGKTFGPKEQGFDVFFPGTANTKPSDTEGGKGEFELTAQAEKFIEENKDKPFFLFLSHNNPHIPLAAKPALIEKYKDSFNPLYAAVIETLDDAVGRVVAKIDALGLGEKTLIVFMSDNGGLHVKEGANTPATHNTPFRAGKGYLYEGGLRVPLIARWTGKIKPSKSDAQVITTDWAPTLLELAEIPAPGKFDGVSFANVLLREEALKPRALCWHFPHYTNQGSRPAGAIREGDWKLIEHYENGALELYNLAQDPSETKDVAASEAGRVAALRGKLEAFRRDAKAQENVPNPKFSASHWKSIYADIDTSKLLAEPTAVATATKLEEWRKLMNSAVNANAGGAEAKQTGAVILHARDAKVHATKMKYEDPPQKDTLGFWVNKDDWAEWDFEAPGVGTYEIEVLQGAGKGGGGAEVEISVAGQTVTFTADDTGHYQRFVPRTIGTVKFEKTGKYNLTLKPKTKPKGAVMDLRRIVIRAAN